ncbi:MAG: hypothetical protein K2W96_08340, partial [Gemmataceae bacterium]|nr:hypothetical protein [Gemmataceae bacterium]
AAARALAFSAQAAAEMLLAQNAVEPLAQALRTVEPGLAPAQKAFTEAQAAAANAPKAVPGLEAALKAAQAKASADAAALAPAEAALKEAQGKLARLSSAGPVAKK